jgi:tRNA(fMet)-specific endonuclease VapC
MSLRVLDTDRSACCRKQAAKLNVRKMDLCIAAIALEHQAIVVTRNVRDFQRVPNLVVEDWSN